MCNRLQSDSQAPHSSLPVESSPAPVLTSLISGYAAGIRKPLVNPSGPQRIYVVPVSTFELPTIHSERIDLPGTCQSPHPGCGLAESGRATK